jgi:site-specific recombinase XerD
MDQGMVLRGMSVRTRQSYLAAVAAMAKYYRRSPDQIGEEEVQRYLLYLIEERKLAWSSCNIAVNALKFCYHVTLKHPQAQFEIPRARQPQKLPQILAREEVARLLELTPNPKHRVMLMTTYGAGLRVSELCHLKVGDIDSARMTIRVEQGKGAKDRYTLLSPRLARASCAATGACIGPRSGCFAPRARSTSRSAPPRPRRSSTRPSAVPASARTAASTGCAMPSPPTCWKRAWTSTPSSG